MTSRRSDFANAFYSEAMRCLISDDCPLVRRGLTKILSESIPDLFTEETVHRETLRLNRKKDWDLLILGTPIQASIEGELLQQNNSGIPSITHSYSPKMPRSDLVFPICGQVLMVIYQRLLVLKKSLLPWRQFSQVADTSVNILSIS